MNIVPVTDFGLLTDGFRNIRMQTDAESGIFDLVPERLLEPGSADNIEQDPTLHKIVKGARLIVEGPTMLRVRFDWLIAVAGGSDVDADIFGGLHAGWRETPKLRHKSVYYPFLEIQSSPWKAQLPEWRGRDNPDIRHFRMISGAVSFDVLGELGAGEWQDNPYAD